MVAVITPHRIGITLGDPSGIGPEIAARAIADAGASLRARLTVFCDAPVLARAFAQIRRDVPDDVIVVDRGQLGADKAVLGEPSEAGARAQVAYLEAAVAAARSRSIGGVVTAPISKDQARRAGFEFPGHTEFFAQRLGAERVAMMFAGPKLRVVLATVHARLGDVPQLLTVDGIAATAVLAGRALRTDFGFERPRIGVVGLNPHAGEGGMFGREEIDIIAPAVEEARRRLFDIAEVAGPLVPDAAFRAAADGAYDVLVAMYHDQALIPVKLVDFEAAVNVTLGLPIVRTSPDHGVAYDIAGKGVARATSFAAALDLAARLVPADRP